MIRARIQDWFADHGIGPYAMPRGRPRRRISSKGLMVRLGFGTLGLFGVITVGATTIAAGFFIMAFVSAVFSGDAPTNP